MAQRGRGGARGRGDRGRGRGRGRGDGPSLVGSRHEGLAGPARGGISGIPSPDVTTVGVKRSQFGQAGTKMEVFTNHYQIDILENIIHHYDGLSLSISPDFTD